MEHNANPGNSDRCPRCGQMFALLNLHELTGECPACFAERPAPIGQPHPALVEMFTECLHYSIPRAYHKDFIWHDLAALRQHKPSDPFLWILRTNGTHIHFEAVHPQLGTMFAHETHRLFYVWDGKRLTRFPKPIEAISCLANLLNAKEATR